MNTTETTQRITEIYGDGSDGSCPTPDQWRRVLDRDPDAALTLINFFKFRDVADYTDDRQSFDDMSGNAAFQRYADVSIPTMERSGGSFLLVAPCAGTFLGADEDWDLIAIGSYPNQQAFLNLYLDDAYIAAFPHRAAAVAAQKVLIATP
ncbi:DUF1330 domain-containing protein [uncultured Tateyamaria sp.]|uniref:DUF1330 domain-containing protein n=1 Tax=Tateyamaria sp. 1078 TaxID=3417464 RepID=UPI00262D495C|nr:DUF1330 domain-containing protein [uncultured Tateyamaria sp.]